MNEQIPWREYLGTLLRRKSLILTVFASGLATAVGLAWLQMPVYEASAKLRVSSERARIRVSPDGSASPAFDPVNEATLTSEAVLLKSVALVREVLEPYRQRTGQAALEPGLAQQVVWRITAALNYPGRLISRLYRESHDVPAVNPFEAQVANSVARLKAAVIGKSNLIQVSYTDADPNWAAEFVNQLVSHHVERHTRLNQQSDTLQFFEEQRQRLSRKQRQAEEALASFSDREGRDSVPEQQALWKSRLAAVETDLNSADVQLVETTARAEFLKKQIDGSRTSHSAESTVVQSGGIPLIKGRILELELQRTQLLSQFTPTSIKVKDVDQQLAEARRLLAAEEQHPSGALAAVGAPGQSLEMDLARAQAEIVAVKARIEALRKRAVEARAQKERLDAISSEYGRLEQEAASAKVELLSYVKSANEAQLSNALDELGIVNVTVVERAEVPTEPLSSTQWRVILLGAFLSLAAGVGLAFVRDHLDPSVKSAAQAERITGLPVLVDIAS